jgi:mannose-6-phosphate isomerase
MSTLIDDEAQRPWGYYEVLVDTQYTKVKEITVNPGHRLSYQSHKHREEYWTCVQGELTVILDGKELYLPYGHSVHIPLGSKHRMWNKGEEDLKVIEVQVGSYFGEDDIERIEDDYRRA